MFPNWQLYFWLIATLVASYETKENPTEYVKCVIDSVADYINNTLKTGMSFQTDQLNRLADLTLELVKNNVAKYGMKVPLPDVSMNFGSEWINSSFVTKEGWFQNLSSLIRIGDVNVTRNGNAITASVNLSLKEFDLYAQYKLTVVSETKTGPIHGTVGHNDIKVHVTLLYDGTNCKCSVDYIKINKLEKIRMQMTGLESFQSQLNSIMNWIIKTFSNDIEKKVESKLGEILGMNNICQYKSFVQLLFSVPENLYKNVKRG